MKNKNETIDKVLSILYKFPLKIFHIRELGRILKISPNAISRAVEQLKKDELVTTNKDVTYNITANLNNSKFKELKRVHNLKIIYDSGLLDYLKGELPLATVILFGSYSLGEDIEKSDIDLAVLDTKEIKLDLEKYEKELARPINIEFVNLDKSTKELKNSILNGIVLHGRIEI